MKRDCCHQDEVHEVHSHHTKHFDYLLWWSTFLVVVPYLLHLFFSDKIDSISYLDVFTSSTFNILNEMAWGMALGIIFVGILDDIPQSFVMKILWKGWTFSGILRATWAGMLLDLCSHGILLVGMKLYQRGASLGQVMAFLIASPWNSISLTLILWALVGFWWMLTFLLLSMVMAIISWLIFDGLVRHGRLPPNKYTVTSESWDISWSPFQREYLYPSKWLKIAGRGLSGSKMILRWLLFGMVLAAAVRTFVPPEMFQTLFGPTMAWLWLTLLVATILEVCSEWSTPVAADILTRAWAPGNSFAFLMTWVSTDYTEVISIKETTKSWKIAFFLPLVTLPQVVIIALVLNTF